MGYEQIQIGNCPTCNAFPCQHIATSNGVEHRFIDRRYERLRSVMSELKMHDLTAHDLHENGGSCTQEWIDGWNARNEFINNNIAYQLRLLDQMEGEKPMEHAP
jgi:hypothetical protein